jgi:hypothetical protein
MLRIIKCAGCGELKEFHARDHCKTCHAVQRRNGSLPKVQVLMDPGDRERLRKAILAAHADGLGSAEIARKVGCKPSYVYGYLRKQGLRANTNRGADPMVRLMAFVHREPSGCWVWQGTTMDNGYGVAWLGGRNVFAHSALFTLTKGAVPRGMQLDHRCHSDDHSCRGGPGCRHRRCVNPDHLEPVTGKVNRERAVARVTHCPKGHPYDEANTYRRRDGSRNCRSCQRLRMAARSAKLRGR